MVQLADSGAPRPPLSVLSDTATAVAVHGAQRRRTRLRRSGEAAAGLLLGRSQRARVHPHAALAVLHFERRLDREEGLQGRCAQAQPAHDDQAARREVAHDQRAQQVRAAIGHEREAASGDDDRLLDVDVGGGSRKGDGGVARLDEQDVPVRRGVDGRLQHGRVAIHDGDAGAGRHDEGQGGQHDGDELHGALRQRRDRQPNRIPVGRRPSARGPCPRARRPTAQRSSMYA
jgi:hypothetical protein